LQEGRATLQVDYDSAFAHSELTKTVFISLQSAFMDSNTHSGIFRFEKLKYGLSELGFEH